jgi:hypothetical protein
MITTSPAAEEEVSLNHHSHAPETHGTNVDGVFFLAVRLVGALLITSANPADTGIRRGRLIVVNELLGTTASIWSPQSEYESHRWGLIKTACGGGAS